MCDPLNDVKTQTLSLEGTTVDCTISDNCLYLQCEVTTTYIPDHYFWTITLQPCTSSIKLVATSSLFEDLINGVYSKNVNISLRDFGDSGNALITIVRQEFGVAVSVSLVL